LTFQGDRASSFLEEKRAMQFHLGRETPYSIQALDREVLVFYRDAICKYSQDDDFKTQCKALVTAEAATVLPGASIVVGSGPNLSVFDHDLQPLATLGTGQEEDIVDLVALSGRSFLSSDEAGRTLFWRSDGATNFTPQGQWPVECTPLFGLAGGKTVVCSERGRLQERDPKTGMMLKTWPKTASAAWGVAETNGYNALTVSEDGESWLWDLSSREALFSLSLDFPAVRGCFRSDGTAGAVLGQDGEVASFKLVDGGETSPLSAPAIPLVSVTYLDRQLVGVDENGGLWQLDPDESRQVGGEWAGWATCSLFWPPAQVFVGTATGSLETFGKDGQKMATSLQLHQDAVVGLEISEGDLLSVGADATIKRVADPGSETPAVHTVAEYPGHSVVGHALCTDSGWLWLGLEDGLVVWISPTGEQGQLQLEGRRVEEIEPAGPGQALVLTDRGSVRCLQADPSPE
jgi:hypothetical protein